MGAGFGLGMAYSNCEKDINDSITQGSALSKPPKKDNSC